MIAIIAILAGMLLPALNKARGKAMDIKCVGNLKQLGVAMSMYISQNDDVVPAANCNYPSNDNQYAGKWQDMLAITVISGLDFSDNCHLSPQNPNSAWSTSVFRPKAMFGCPASVPEFIPKFRDPYYGINMAKTGERSGFASGATREGPVMKITRIRKPGERAAMFDIDRNSDSGTPGSGIIEKSGMITSATVKGEWRHGDKTGANIAYADGHVGFLKEKSIPENYWYNNKLGYFWSTTDSR